ncbi:UDP-N-acetylmuramate dehydrogenase [Actomonas aquatica]|uniref:UDP-N-acetylenolpyruvoylglucosamine reductase n=1 Tax=Actomonas aquatica TaxID=2866162 RepID=A0ABZ1CCD5_9BACT|nr:UDP-N-acetylmuramate dehydrogenase [Opitutus sp. WL0086]WRQ89101.1 UDP-N-acetylmuramate dehydrogenase [Opitutus sp. WL0086]
MIDSTQSTLFGRSVRRVHAVGVGGMGLGPLVVFLAGRGWSVSGEDVALSPAMAVQLDRVGVRLTDEGELPVEVDLVVISSAISSSHPTCLAATEQGIPVVRRGELLAELARNYRLVAVCGSHGKTTTTALLLTALRAQGVPVGYVLGGLWVDDELPPAAVGAGDWLIAEIDESDGTIEHFAPEITVLVNLDWDHADHYTAETDLVAAFAGLLQRTRTTVLGWEGCALTQRLLTQAPAGLTAKTFGRDGDFRLVTLESGAGEQQLQLGGELPQLTVTLRARGEFNALNATAALGAMSLMGETPAAEVFADYRGVRRRQTVLLADADLTVIEDYAHHPAEIRALLGSLRQDLAEGQRLVVVFQPHRFSRTRQFKVQLAAALAQADALHLLDVYGAGEAPLPGGTTADLYAELVQTEPELPVNYLPGDAAGVLELLRQSRRAGDVVAFVGAGDIEKRAREWLAELAEETARRSEWDGIAHSLREVLSADAKVVREEPLAKKTTMRIGGAARIYVEPESTEDLAAVVQVARRAEVPVRMLGRGSNLLVPDAGVDAIVVSLRRPAWETFTKLADGRVRVGAGLRLKNLCGLAAKAGLSGFEFLEGIPGNVGGALRMNAGAMGGWMFDVVESVDVVTSEGEVINLPREELHTGYRHCRELANCIAVQATLRPVTRASADAVGRKIDVYRSKRQESQPREPSAGCIFKNPEGDSAGRLIDVCGLKGTRIGDAEVSTTHGNFIINRGHATSADVIELVRRVRTKVHQEAGVLLQPEVLLYGSEWEDVL